MALNITVSLDEKQVQEAITFWLKAQGLNVKKVRFDATLHYGQLDRGPGTPVFSKAVAEVEPIDQTKPFNSFAAQIAAVEGDPRPYGDH